MRTFIHAAMLAVSITGGTLLAQQPAPTPQPRQPGAPETAPPGGDRMERRGPPGGDRMERREPPAGFRMMIFSPTMLLERREALGLSPDQVTKLSTLENDLKTARDKAETDAKPHRDELDKLWQQNAPDVTQVRTHAQAMMQAEVGVRVAALASTAQAKAILTPEQRGRVQGWADSRRADRGRGMRPGGPNRGPGMRRPAGFGMQRGANSL